MIKAIRKLLCKLGIHQISWKWSANKVLKKAGNNYKFGDCKGCEKRFYK